MIKYIQCRKCSGKNGKVNNPGYISSFVPGTDGTPVEVVTECECHVKWRKSVELENKASRAGLNPKWLNFDIEQDYVGTKSKENIERIKKYVLNFIKPANDEVKKIMESASLYLYGPNGTQKTTVANWIGYECLRHNKTVKYILMNDLIKLLQRADRDEDEQAKLDKILEVDCLILDESLSKDKVTVYKSNYQIPFLDSFLRNRIQGKNKGIIFISNTSLDDIDEQVFGKSIKDLVIRNTRGSAHHSDLLLEDRWVVVQSEIDIENLF